MSAKIESARLPDWDLSGDNNGHEIEASSRRRSASGESVENDFVTGATATTAPSTPTPTPTAQPTTPAAPQPAPEQPAPSGMFTAAQVMRDRHGNNPDLPPPAPPESRCPLLCIVLKSKAVKDALAAAKAAQSNYKDTLAKVDHLLDPNRRHRELIEKINASTDADEIQRLKDEAALVHGEAGFAAQQSARRMATAEYQKLHSALNALFDATESELRKLGGEVEKSEAVLFRVYGLKREATPISHRLKQNLNRLALHRESVALNVSRERQNSVIPGHQAEVLAMFAD